MAENVAQFVQLLWVSTGNYFIGLKDDGSVWKADTSPLPLVWSIASGTMPASPPVELLVGTVEVSDARGVPVVFGFGDRGSIWKCLMDYDGTDGWHVERGWLKLSTNGL